MSDDAVSVAPRTFELVDGDGAVAQGTYVFGYYLVSWLGEVPDHRPYPSIDAAISAHHRQNDSLQVHWS